MKTMTISDNDLLELKLLRDRLDRVRRDSTRKADGNTMRSSDLDREVEVLCRVVKLAGG